jgi:hypothetical protein
MKVLLCNSDVCKIYQCCLHMIKCAILIPSSIIVFAIVILLLPYQHVEPAINFCFADVFMLRDDLVMLATR